MHDPMSFLKQVIPKDKEVTLVWHRLSSNVPTGPIVHEDEDEYFICGAGKVKTIINESEEIHEFSPGVNYLYIPKNTPHNFMAEGENLDYFAIRIKK